jgi:hypothetical protein
MEIILGLFFGALIGIALLMMFTAVYDWGYWKGSDMACKIIKDVINECMDKGAASRSGEPPRIHPVTGEEVAPGRGAGS